MIYIAVRRTTDWENKAVVYAQLPEGFRHKVALWDATFLLPYHVFRQELTRIARINCWPSAFIEDPISTGHRLGLIGRAIFPRTPPKWLCTTNNYAVTMSPAAGPLIDSHLEASHWFVANPGVVKRLDGHLSVMNRTLASQTSFWHVRSQEALFRKFHRYHAVYRRPLAPELAWCEPFVAMMRDLMDGLRRRG